MRRILFLVTVGLIGFAMLVALGTWQVRRLNWKQEILARIETRVAADPVAFPQNPDPQRDKYLSVALTGTMAPGEVHVLMSLKQIGAGYRVIAPYDLEGGRRIMIDRGFVPTGAKDAQRRLGPMAITGNLHWPDEIDSYTPAPDRTGNIWFARDVAEMAAALDSDPILVIARNKTDPHVTPLPVDRAGIPNDHLQYAITWFSLALIWAAMSVYFLRRTQGKPARTNQKDP